MWVSRCKWRCRDGNERDENSEEELNDYTREEFVKGEEGLPEHSLHLMDCDVEDVIDFPLSKKRIWFNSIEAARGRVPMIHNKEREAEEDMRCADCEPQRECVRKWIATGWRQALADHFV